jgi:hypothetical protein
MCLQCYFVFKVLWLSPDPQVRVLPGLVRRPAPPLIPKDEVRTAPTNPLFDFTCFLKFERPVPYTRSDPAYRRAVLRSLRCQPAIFIRSLHLSNTLFLAFILVRLLSRDFLWR